jgi:hypothetical protein
MRRILILLLAIVLPFKAVAAAVVPIVGSPNHAHAPHAADAGHAHCDAAAAAVDADADTLHEHACPHLAMVMLAANVPALEPQRGTPRVAAETERAPPSVVLDVPSPPPTAQS